MRLEETRARLRRGRDHAVVGPRDGIGRRAAGPPWRLRGEERLCTALRPRRVRRRRRIRLCARSRRRRRACGRCGGARTARDDEQTSEGPHAQWKAHERDAGVGVAARGAHVRTAARSKGSGDPAICSPYRDPRGTSGRKSGSEPALANPGHSERSPREAQAEARNRTRPDREAPLPG